MNQDELKQYRDLIDSADRQIVEGIEKRFDAVRKIGEYKKANGLAIFDPKREAIVLDHVASLCHDPFYVPYIRELYQMIMDSAKKMEEDVVEP